MTSRERILRTVRRLPTDRVPISMCELSPVPDGSYAAFANTDPSYAGLMRAVERDTDTVMLVSPKMRYPRVEERTETRTVRRGRSTFVTRTIHTPKGDLTAATRRDDDVHTTWTLEHFCKTPADMEKYCSLDFTAQSDASTMLRCREQLGERGVICPTLHDPLCRACDLFSMEDFLVLVMTEPEAAGEFLDFLWELARDELNQLLKTGLKDEMVRIVGAEYAAPPYLPPSYFEAVEGRFLRPALEMIHAAGAVSRVHAHGKVGAILPQIAACGAMIAEPVEPPPDGDLPLREAKRLYGDRLTIMGNIELKELEYASAERVRELVRETMRVGKPGGGFIFMPTATPINTPLAKRTEENLITMIEAALEYGAYGTESDR